MGAAAGDAGEAERGAGERKSSNRLGKKQGREERTLARQGKKESKQRNKEQQRGRWKEEK